ncbi:hypothetical protein AAZX31_18G122000 [Glycine max]
MHARRWGFLLMVQWQNQWEPKPKPVGISLDNYYDDLTKVVEGKVTPATRQIDHVLDQYRNCLSPKIVETLVCLEDWLKGSPTPLPSKEDLEEIDKIEQDKIYLIEYYFLFDYDFVYFLFFCGSGLPIIC